MPKKSYTTKLTHLEIIELIDTGKYRVDLDKGHVYSGRTGNKLFTFAGEDASRRGGGLLFLRLFDKPKFITIGVSQVIWIYGTRSKIPEGFEVHHRDENQKHNWFKNLLCLHSIDHRKFHYSNDEAPF